MKIQHRHRREIIFDIRSTEDGVSILELTLLLPLLLAFIAALVDFGIKFNMIKQISHAARHSARVAASHSRRVMQRTEAPAVCSEEDDARAVINEICPAGQDQALMLTDSIARAAHKAACNTLLSTNLDSGQWRVKTSVDPSAVENGSDFTLIKVEIVKDKNDCLICYERIHESFEAKAMSEFVLEERCV